jgi:hypothetical protein
VIIRCFNVTKFIFLGILEKEQEQSVVYGSTDFGKTCTTNDKYKELVNQ